MKAASDAYSTARLITRSMSYSRYLSTAIAIVASRQITATSVMTVEVAELVTNRGTSATPSTPAAIENQVSCSRSVPDDLMNRATTATAQSASVAGSGNRSDANGPGVYTR